MTDPEDRTTAPAGNSSPADPDASAPDASTEVPLEPPVTAEVEPVTAEVELAPATEVEPVPAAEIEPVPPPVKVDTDVVPAATPGPRPPDGPSRRPDLEEDAEGSESAGDAASDDLEPIPRWVALVHTLGVGLIAVMAAWVLANVVEGFYYPKSQGGVLQNDLLHRLGVPFAGLQVVITLVALIVAVLLVSLPVLLDEDVTYGQERSASVALAGVVVLAIIICLGSILGVRYTLHAIQAQGPVLAVQRVEQTAFLVVTLGTGLLVAYGALVARGLRYGTD